MARIRKAVFPVGGLGTRFLPATKAMPKEMLAVVDKPLIQYVVEEARAAGIEEFIFVTGKGKTAIEDHFDHAPELEATLEARNQHDDLQALRDIIPPEGQIAYTRQMKPLGLGHAVWCARNLVGDEPFAVLLADDLILSQRSCLKQMMEAYEQTAGNIVAIMEVAPDQTSRYGIIEPQGENGSIISIKSMVEKPAPENAPSNLGIIGRYILQPQVFDHLDKKQLGAGGEIQLTDALAAMTKTHPFYGCRFSGQRFDCGSKLGMVRATLQVALEHPDLKDDVLNELQAMVAQTQKLSA